MTPPTKLPTKPPTDTLPRVYRGGGWFSAGPLHFRAAYRNGYTPASRCDILGFRCAQRGCRKPVGKVTP